MMNRILFGVLFLQVLLISDLQAQYKLRFHVTYNDESREDLVPIGSFRMYDTTDGTPRFRRGFSTDIDIGRGRTYDIELDFDPRDYMWNYLNITNHCPGGPCFDRPTGSIPIYRGPNVCGATVMGRDGNTFGYRIDVEYSGPQSAPRLPGGGTLDNICSESVLIETAERATTETYTWEVSRTASGPWHSFATTTGTNVNRTTISRALLNAAINDGQSGNTFQVRVKASGCWEWAQRISPSSLTAFQSGVPSSVITAVTPPGCRGGNNGIIQLTALRNADGSLFQPPGNLTYFLTSPENIVYNLISNANTDIQINAANGIPVTAGNWRIDILGVGLTCSKTVNVVVSEPALMTFQSAVISQPIVCADGTGAVSVSVNNGSAPYTYTLTRSDQPAFQLTATSNQASHTFSSLLPGTYRVRVNSCSQVINTSDIALNGAVNPIAVFSLTSTNVSCGGQTNGTLTVTASGGTAPYAVQVNGGSFVNLVGSSYTAGGLAAGIQQVRVRDANGCLASGDVVVNTNLEIGGSLEDLQSVTCAGGSNGLVILKAKGSAGVTFEYSLNGTTYQPINGFAGLSAGTYAVSIRDKNAVACRWDSSVVISEPLPIHIDEFVVASAINCYGENTGSLRALASGGTPQFGYTYDLLETVSLDNESRTSSSEVLFNNLSAGNYRLTVADGTVNCFVTADLLLTEPAEVFLNPVLSDYYGSQVSCPASSDGSITVRSVGGIYPHRISVSGRSDQLIPSSGEAVVFDNFPSGDYFFTITNNNGACQKDTLIRLLAPPPIALSLSAKEYGDGYQVSCKGSSNGEVSAKGSGGTLPYTYSITPGGTPLLYTDVNLDSVSFTNLRADNYRVTLTDINNCSTEAQLVMTEPLELEVDTIIKTDIFGKQLKCKGDADAVVTVYTRGGSYPQTVTLLSNAQQGISNSSTQGVVFDQLSANAYTFQVEDEEGCTVNGNFILVEPDAVALDNSQTAIEKPDCAGQQTGSLHAEALGGIGTSYRYELTYLGDRSRLPFPYPEQQVQTGNPIDFNLLIAGSYHLEVADEVGCRYSEAITLSTNLQVTASVATTDITCKHHTDGSASVTIAGGIAPYALLWNHQDQPIQADDHVMENAMNTIHNLKEGLYSFEITDANGCAYYTGNYTFQIEGPGEPLILEASVTPVSCQGEGNGVIVLEARGGWQELAYQYGTDPLHLTINERIHEELSPGMYTYYVKDNRGCIDTLEVYMTEPETLAADILKTRNVSCHGLSDGSFELNIEGGSVPYQVSIDNGLSWKEGNEFDLLKSDSYYATVRDAHGCETHQLVTITEPEVLKATLAEQSNTLCRQSTGSATVTVTGGTPAYVYSWINSEQAVLAHSLTASDLTAGTYTFKVTDDHACENELTVHIINTNDIIFQVVNIQPVNCYGEVNGSAEIQLTAIQSPYTILWDNGATGLSTASLQAGENTVVLEDANQCQVSTTFNVPGPEALSLNTTQSVSPSCYGTCDGMLSVQAAGGNGGYSYTWLENSSVTHTISNVCAGDYTVTVRDARNCVLESRMTLNGPALHQLGIEDTTYYICQGQQVNISLPAWTQHSWSSSNGFTSQSAAVSLAEAGDYGVTAVDAAGCMSRADFKVIYSTDLLKSEFLVPKETYVGDTIVCVNLSLPQPESWTWNFDQTNIVSLSQQGIYQQLVFLKEGEYVLTLVSYLGGCVAEQSKKVIVLKDNSGGEEQFNLGYEEKGIKEVNIFPNPNDGHFTCEVFLHQSEQMQLKVVDLYGHVLTTFEGAAAKEFKADLSIGNQHPGLYWMVITVGDDVKTVKVLVK